MSFKNNLELIVDQFDDDVYKDQGVFSFRRSKTC